MIFNQNYGSLNDGGNAVTNPNKGDEDIEVKGIENNDNEYSENADFRYITSTPQERRRNFVNAFIPVVMFVVFMGGVAFTLFKSIDVLYPGHGNEQNSHAAKDQNKHISKSYTLPSDSTSSSSDQEYHYTDNTQMDSSSINSNSAGTSDNNDTSSGPSNCALYSKCTKLGLIGYCCPTSDGTLLACCN